LDPMLHMEIIAAIVSVWARILFYVKRGFRKLRSLIRRIFGLANVTLYQILPGTVANNF
jgi:hypothetical protein